MDALEGPPVTVMSTVGEGTENTETDPTGQYTRPPNFVRLSKKEKKALRAEQFKATKKDRKKDAKLRRKEKRKEVLEANPDAVVGSQPRKKKRKLEDITWSSQKVVIDLGFDDVMLEPEVISLASQIRLCYSCNHKLERPYQLYFTDFGGRTQARCDGWEKWKVNIETKSYLEIFPKESLVYLTADSDNVVEELDSQKVYIIGGIVDHNRLKSLTLNKAKEQGIATAQLPIGKYLAMSSRKVLTVNHVYEILLAYGQTKSWEHAFQSVLPKRKKAELLPGEEEEGEGDSAIETKVDEPCQVEGEAGLEPEKDEIMTPLPDTDNK